MPRESGKPRGKTSAYGYFVKMCYSEHKNKYPTETVQVTEISKKCAEKWKTMTPHEKQRFHELAQKDAERYNAECSAFNGAGAAVGSPSAGAGKRKRGKKDPQAPKRALSAFFLFSRDKRPEVQQGHPEWKVGQVAQELGRQWKEIEEDLKRKYEIMAQSGKTQYESDMRDYKAGKKVGVGGASVAGNVNPMASAAAVGGGGIYMSNVAAVSQPMQVSVGGGMPTSMVNQTANAGGGVGHDDDVDDDEEDDFEDDDE